MTTVEEDVLPDLAAALGKRPADTVKEVQLMAALKLFDAGRISSGLAARLAGMPRALFLLTCGQYGVSVFQETAEEIMADAEAVRNARGG